MSTVARRPAPSRRASAGRDRVFGSERLLTAALQISLVLAGGAVAVAILTVAGNSLDGQKLAFCAAFGVALPAGYVGGERLAWRAIGRSPEQLTLLAGGAAAGVLATVVTARSVYALGGTAAPVILVGAAGVAAALAGLHVYPPRRPPVRAAMLATVAAGVLLPVSVVAFLPDRLLRPGPLTASLLGAAALLLVLGGTRRFHLPRWLGRALDVAALALAVLLVIDVSGYVPHLPYDPNTVFTGRSLTPNDETFVLVLHQNFYLAPINDILHGRAMLVDTYSQYGVGAIYFLAGFFKLAPLGYGPLILISGVVTGLGYAAAYAILRIAGCPRPLAAITLGVALVVAVFGTIASVAYFPSVGGVRYALGYALILTAVAAARWPHRTALRALQLGIVGVSSVWSVETFAMVGGTFAVMTAGSAAIAPGPRRDRARRWAADLLRAAAVCVAAWVLFALLTLAFTGDRPHLRPYLAFVGVYGGNEVVVQGVPLARPWSAGFAVLALYLASASALVALVRRREQADRHDPWLVSAVGATAFGVLTFTYWVSRADPLAIPPLSLPAIMVGALWVHRALRPATAAGRGLRLGSVAFAGWLAMLAVVFAWPQVERKYTRTAAWQALPGGPGLRSDVRALWRSPVIDRRTLEAQDLLRRYFPGKGPVPMLIEADLGVETLIRSRRVNRLPLGDIAQDNLISHWLLPRVDRALGRLRPGTLILLQSRAVPRTKSSEQPPMYTSIVALLRRRFDFQLVAASPSSLAVVRLVPRRRTGGPPTQQAVSRRRDAAPRAIAARRPPP